MYLVKNYIIIGLACLVAALAFGVEPVQRGINETVNKGTLKGVETCLSYSKSELISNEAVRATCVTAFQKPLYGNDHATGRAGPRLDQRYVAWEGELENKTSDHVTTWIRVSVSIYDADGAEQEFFGDTTIWIDPLDEAAFRVELPELEREKFDSIEFCDHDDLTPSACLTWGVVETMGLAI
ncbi:MAG: hypothetical protein ABJ360_02235 [Roseobacter sp.]|uniref:hypothetical protein n=1 Tax=Tateyamaria sp. TaxID=1929288 RepID=UPI0032962D5C